MVTLKWVGLKILMFYSEESNLAFTLVADPVFRVSEWITHRDNFKEAGQQPEWNMGAAETLLIHCFLILMMVAYAYSYTEHVLFRVSQSKNFKHYCPP